ncbi:hypothetical protein GGI05_007720, partial [Coemansia sp. RSA 2603]
ESKSSERNKHTATVVEEKVKVDVAEEAAKKEIEVDVDVKETSKEVVVHEHGHGHHHHHDGDDHVHPPGPVIQYKEAPPQFGLATHVDDIIHTEFRYVSGFKPFQFDAPGSCLGPLVAEDQKTN